MCNSKRSDNESEDQREMVSGSSQLFYMTKEVKALSMPLRAFSMTDTIPPKASFPPHQYATHLPRFPSGDEIGVNDAGVHLISEKEVRAVYSTLRSDIEIEGQREMVPKTFLNYVHIAF